MRTAFDEAKVELTLGELADAVESVPDELRQIGEPESSEMQHLREDGTKLKKYVALLQT